VVKTELCTDSGLKFVKVAPNAFGFIDSILSKGPVQVLVLGKLQSDADINGLMDLLVDIVPQVDGKMSLLINPAQNEHIHYSQMILITTSNSTVGFFNIASKVSNKTSGTVSVEQFSDDLNLNFHGRLPAFDMFEELKLTASELEDGVDSVIAVGSIGFNR